MIIGSCHAPGVDLCPTCSAPLNGRTVRRPAPDEPLQVRELRRCKTCDHVAWRPESDTGPWSDAGSGPEHDYLFATLQPLPEPWSFIPHGEKAELEAQLRTEVPDEHPLRGKKVIAIARCGGCDEVVYSVEEDPGWFARVHLTWRSAPGSLPWPTTTPLALPLVNSLADHAH
ncbi:hypothetical protein SK854_46695 [Lentzea sp. BCCO 10_0061]|uniref:Uncharacterized protein n=1 Tax=Lentzea sokolovensis TaxID=3095429 RepID=A0ABU4VCZ8_9PSEU|nr:hypothetical protein [Lentzea sp. BCCO 10_0061]MDX8149681.1 hypothetical protein [Lentzea sp. BCCO 10_0061]